VRRRNAAGGEEIELNLTAALDVIFNILAFFIITFRLPLPEKNFDVRLPPPKAMDQSQATGEPASQEPFKQVTIALEADANGRLSRIRLEDRVVTTVSGLVRELKLTTSAINVAGSEKLDSATIVASPRLKYEHVIAVVDACYRADIQKIGFAETTEKSLP
jgi:biopolymer transport protein ExbD